MIHTLSLEKFQNNIKSLVKALKGNCDQVRGDVRAMDDRRGTLLPGTTEGTGTVKGVRGGYDSIIFGGSQDDTAWASGRGEMELENLGHCGRAADVFMDFPDKGGPQRLPSEGFPGQAATKTAMQVHFLHRHVLDTMFILEEGNLPHPR